MPAQAEEFGVKTSKPIEIYDLTIGSTVYRYTSYRKDVIYAGNTYTAIAIERGNVGISAQGDTSEMMVSIDKDADFIQDQLVGVPQFNMVGSIYSIQNGVGIGLWAGTVDAITLTGGIAKIRISSGTDTPLQKLIPSFCLARQCQHKLYTGLCQSQRTDHDFLTTVSSVDGETIVVNSVNSHPDGWYNGGFIEIGGISRDVVNQVGTTLTLLNAFGPDVNGGESCTLLDGCDKSIVDCDERHDQVANFGGHPYLKHKNPFLNRLAWED